jgi:hypothetical protein
LTGEARLDNAGVAVDHARHSASEICIKKVQFHQQLGFDANVLISATGGGAAG